MAFEQVVVTLTPVYSPDTLPFRSLTFSSNHDTIPIGRASKSVSKNLIPDHDNAWFDSRVISREHGVMSVRMEDKAVFIRDHGSLHGTQLNDIMITPKQNVPVHSGDVITFGSEIARGPQTFRPIAVRLDCQWHEKRLTENTKPTTNTFSVPDDEDDVLEIVDYNEVSVKQKASQDLSDSSDFGYGSDMSRPLDLTSPVTSPEVRTFELPKKPIIDANKLNDAQNGPAVNSDESMVPPSSPPPAHSVSMFSKPQIQSDHEDESSSESENSENEEQRVTLEDDSDGSEESDGENEYEGCDSDGEPLCDVQASSFSVFETEPPHPMTAFSTTGAISHQAESSTAARKQPFSTLSVQPDMAANTHDTAFSIPVQSGLGKGSWPEFLMQRAPSPSDKAMAKPMNSSTPGPTTVTVTAPTYQPYSDYASNIEMWPNNQGLTNENSVDMTASYGSVNANDSIPFGPHRSASGYLRNLANEYYMGPQVQTNSGGLFPIMNSRNEATKQSQNDDESSKKKVSIADIVEVATHAKPSASNALKRKVDEITADLIEESKELDNSQDNLPDAQPREEVQNIDLTQSHQLETQEIKDVQDVKARNKNDSEHRRKRVKMQQASAFLKYAAIAAVGAAVGSIGTIAGLASLPNDFFH